MTKNTRIYNRFPGYSTSDCACEYCLHWGSKNRGCRLDECCCMEDHIEATQREQGADSGLTVRKEG